MTEIEKQTTTEQEQSTPTFVVPEFKPFEFGTPSEEPAFEVEKQYPFEPDTYKEFGEKAREMSQPTVEKSAEIVAKNQIVARPRLNARGKIIASVYSIIVAIIVAFCIYNAVCISSLKNEIYAKNQIVAENSQVINDLQDSYNSLGDDDTIKGKVQSKYRDPEQDDIVIVDDYAISERSEQSLPNNWFERLCQKLANLFS